MATRTRGTVKPDDDSATRRLNTGGPPDRMRPP
jgi:hypothetical protein